MGLNQTTNQHLEEMRERLERDIPFLKILRPANSEVIVNDKRGTLRNRENR